MSRHDHPANAVGFGLAYLLAGTALLLQEFDLLTLRWSVVLPSILVAVGATVVLSGIVSARRSAAGRTDLSAAEAQRSQQL